MATYEQKLTLFVQGKRLLRLSRPVRDRADACCDACGSTQPRTLYPLKELDSGRHYFVGDSCLKELVKLGAIPRRYSRESGQGAYETEMHLRAQESKDAKTASGVNDTAAAPTTPDSKPLAGDARSASPTEVWHLFPAVLIIEAPEHYQGFVYLTSVDGMAYGWGQAKEPRYEETWRLGGEGGLLLEKVKAERPDARILCLNQAWEQAHSHLEGRNLVVPPPNGGDRPGPSPSGPLLALLQLMTPTSVSSDYTDAPRKGEPVVSAFPDRSN
ncbi:MAG: hypothetical protein O6914_06005 [Chloroflexi bacterium]|jgi:hypothetical protein|nr:hypothetical protein [Chloroflexota bacterium]MCZ6866820.1 hypothetical protein [Chloroflexota bacterium]